MERETELSLLKADLQRLQREQGENHAFIMELCEELSASGISIMRGDNGSFVVEVEPMQKFATRVAALKYARRLRDALVDASLI